MLVIDGTVIAGLLIAVSFIPRDLLHVGLPEAFLTGFAFSIISFSVSAVFAMFARLLIFSKASAIIGFAVLIITTAVLIAVIQFGFELKKLS